MVSKKSSKASWLTTTGATSTRHSCSKLDFAPLAEEYSPEFKERAVRMGSAGAGGNRPGACQRPPGARYVDGFRCDPEGNAKTEGEVARRVRGPWRARSYPCDLFSLISTVALFVSPVMHPDSIPSWRAPPLCSRPPAGSEGVRIGRWTRPSFREVAAPSTLPRLRPPRVGQDRNATGSAAP